MCYRDILELEVCDMLQMMLISSLDTSPPIGKTLINGAVLIITSTASSLPSSFNLSTRQEMVLFGSFNHSFNILDVGLWAGLSPGSRWGSISVSPSKTASMHQSLPMGSGGSSKAHSFWWTGKGRQDAWSWGPSTTPPLLLLVPMMSGAPRHITSDRYSVADPSVVRMRPVKPCSSSMDSRTWEGWLRGWMRCWHKWEGLMACFSYKRPGHISDIVWSMTPTRLDRK